ncbi:MAG: Maf family protein, partial [Alphaproteobacteria bacterium GM7ARS4]|nr:Maf family protein [Alphaproteobacteria bacterium GM7ARS4]
MPPRPSLILASRSKTRHALIKHLTLPLAITCQASGIQEKYPPQDVPSRLAMHWAKAKARAMHERKTKEDPHALCFILAADTVVSRGKHIMGTPTHEEEAHAMLQRLDGRRFTVTTALHVINPHGQDYTTKAQTHITFGRLGTKKRTAYLSTSCWRHRAAGLDLACHASPFIRSMTG